MRKVALLVAVMLSVGCGHLIYTADGPANSYITAKSGAYLAARLGDVELDDLLMVRSYAVEIKALISAEPESLPATLEAFVLAEGEKMVPENDRAAFRSIMSDIFLHVRSEGGATDEQRRDVARLILGGVIDGLNLAIEVYGTGSSP